MAAGMTPDEEARFIGWWREGKTVQEIGGLLGIPVGTARSRAFTLQQAGKIERRPKGGSRTRGGGG